MKIERQSGCESSNAQIKYYPNLYQTIPFILVWHKPIYKHGLLHI